MQGSGVSLTHWLSSPEQRATAHLSRVTVSMRVMSAGDGYKYLLRTVAAGDGDRSLSTPLTRYYAEVGTPPGQWIGGGLAGLAGGWIVEGDQVSEAQLQLIVGMGRDPITGDPLGRAYPAYRSVAARIEERTATLDPELGPVARAKAVAAIEAEEAERGTRRAVAGFDFTFSIPKSASVLWAVADAGTQALIADAHHAAVAEVVAFMEREVAATRTGATGRDGAVAQVDVTGLIATAFDHYDSRAGDPHLHTHVVISNKVQTVLDGRWRSLDGRPMHAAVVALSELHEAVFADHLTRAFGVEWEARAMGRDRNPAWAIASVPEELVAEFSTRSRHIDAETDRVIDSYVTEHGRRPSAATIMKLRAQATLSTRPQKEVHSLADLTADWRARAGRVLGSNPTGWASTVVVNDAPLLLRADDVPLDVIANLGQSVVEAVGEKRSTWRRWNLTAEAARQTMGYRFATVEDREAVVGLVVDAAEAASLRLTPPELASSPAVFQRPDGTSVFRPKHSTVFSSELLLAAEDRLLERARTTTGPTVPLATVEKIASRPDREGRMLGDDQAAALVKVAVSGRQVDVLVGPAGAGKTTAMNALRRAWEREHGKGSVVGLAPSAVAAQVLADDLGIGTENTAKWWQNHLVTGETFRADQLVIVDEASLAGTLSLDRVTALAAEAGAKVLLVGDYAQLQSVDAGGAFGMLVHDRDDAPELVDVHRFTHAWEKTASLALRHGRPEVIDTYIDHSRVLDGDTEAMTDAAYTAWRADLLAGKATVLVTDSNEAVTALNVRARTDLILDGTVRGPREVELHDGTRAATGDTVITRRNDRRLRAGRGWVRNGDRWTVTEVRDDGSVTLRRAGRRWGASVVLPADYVAEHLDLGYAVTSYRAQGVTVDSSHVLADASMTRETFYVAMTRGREANIAYVAVDKPDASHDGPHPGDNEGATARSVLFGVLQHACTELSVHETITAEQDAWGSIAQLAAEYETLAAAAQHDRWALLIRSSGLTDDEADDAIASPAFGALTAELRRAEANQHDVESLLPRLVQARGFEDADDIAAVLHFRVARATARPAGSGRARRAPRLIAGLIPQATGAMSAEMRQALTERRDLIESRVTALLDTALNDAAPWTTALGPEPKDAKQAAAWRRAATVVAAYRDRYAVTGPSRSAHRSRLRHRRSTPPAPVPRLTGHRTSRELNGKSKPDAPGRSTPDHRCEPSEVRGAPDAVSSSPLSLLVGHHGFHDDCSSWIGDTYLLTPFARTEVDVAADEVSVNLGDATPRRLLVDWANGQDAWVRQLTAETILSRQAPSDALLNAAYATFLAEKGLGDGDAPEIPRLELAAADAAEEDTLELVSLASIEGVNALAADQELGFDSELTVLFGQNGSGKTGYARILKRISAVRTAEDILPNAHAVHLDTPPSPSADITYRLSGTESSVRWRDEAGLAPFTRISVFDASAVSLHVDSDLGYVYTPAELALFAHVAMGIQGVQQRIAAEVSALAPGSNPLLSRFTRGTKMYPVIETLGATTDLANLDALATLPEDAEADRERLEGEVAALRSNSLDAILSSSQETERQLTRLLGILNAAQNFDAAVYETARSRLEQAEQRRAEAREQLFSQDELPGPADEEWQEFIVAGDSYRQHLGREHYPTTGDSCLYCMQELSPTALNLLTRYRTFLDETLIRQVQDANATLAASKFTVNEADLARAIEFASEQQDHEKPPAWAGQACEVLGAIRVIAQETADGQPVAQSTLREDARVVVTAVSTELESISAAGRQMADDKANAATALAEKQKAVSELVARIELNRNLAAAREYVRRARRAQQLEKLSRVISSGASKQLTVQSKLASEDLVNKNFETLFAEECARLRAPQVALRFQGRSGQAQRKKAVASYKPSAVLSEGEQKVLALADFLAESRMRGTKAPLIFDDPVTSLDYRRLDEVAARIQNLAETHQVVVLTHNIMFASALIATRQNKKLRTRIYEVRDGGETKGILAPDVEPRLDTPADLAKRINAKLQEMPSAEPVVQDALIKETYDLIRAWCEAFVEQELLQNVTQRYRKNIMMTRLSKIDSSRLDDAIAVIEPLFDRACERMTGHSHAAEYMSTKPTVGDVQEDWEKAKAARASYIAA